ncbi:MAG: hypothetical protein NT090_03830, partial [Acidobacteria bacterium]|nr:hypothetical protein [Acidobacteriota bacterium]
MHHPTDPRRRTVATAYYVDDSGSEETTKLAVVGGVLLVQRSFFSFHYEWSRIAGLHKVQLPIHMKEFARPDGRLACLNDSERRALFTDLVYLTNKNKVYSLTTAVSNLEFQQFFPPARFRGLIGPAPLAFLWCMILNHVIIADHERMGKMAYIVDKSHLSAQMTDCYNFWTSYETRGEEECTGSLTFERASEVCALQAADMIAWANRKRHLGQEFIDGFEPLDLLTRYVESDVKPSIHFHFPVTEESTKKLAAILGDPVRRKGRRFSLLGVVSPQAKRD